MLVGVRAERWLYHSSIAKLCVIRPLFIGLSRDSCFCFLSNFTISGILYISACRPKAAKVTAAAVQHLPKSLNLRDLIIMSGFCPSESDRCIEIFMKQQHFLQLQATVNLLC